MYPVGRTIYLWRTHKGLTQSFVATRAGVSRPNLSAIEQGTRDLTVRTLRRIADGLGINPGKLADGIPPGLLPAGTTVSQGSLKRIAGRAAGSAVRVSRREAAMARLLAMAASSKIEADTGIKQPFYGLRKAFFAHHLLKAQLGFQQFSQLVNALGRVGQRR